MKREFEMTEQQCAVWRAASTWDEDAKGPNVPRINRFWELLGKQLGFSPLTADPVPHKGERFFTAEVDE